VLNFTPHIGKVQTITFSRIFITLHGHIELHKQLDPIISWKVIIMQLQEYFLKLFILSLLMSGDAMVDTRENLTDLITTNISNNILRCSARNTQGPIQIPQQPITVLIVRSILVNYYLLVAFFGIILNGFVIFLVIKYKTLHTIDFTFAAQISFISFISSVLLVPFSVTSVISGLERPHVLLWVPHTLA